MIYAVQDALSGRVKIGFTRNPRGRFAKMRTDCPGELTMLGLIEGSVADEAALHRRFAHLRVRGEWFEGDDELRAWIGTLGPAIDGPRALVTRPKHLSEAMGISASYASQIISGKRIPHPALALKIFRQTGLRFGLFKAAA